MKNKKYNVLDRNKHGDILSVQRLVDDLVVSRGDTVEVYVKSENRRGLMLMVPKKFKVISLNKMNKSGIEFLSDDIKFSVSRISRVIGKFDKLFGLDNDN